MLNPGYRIQSGVGGGEHPPMFRASMFCVPFRCVALRPSSRTSGEAAGSGLAGLSPRMLRTTLSERKYFDSIDRMPKRRPNCA
jgi:hypothetical protein